MLDLVIRDWLEPSPLHPLRAMSGNMWALHPSLVHKERAPKLIFGWYKVGMYIYVLG
jgi:hypothetical protein